MSQPRFELKDKVVIVTGASSGIGASLVKTLAQEGSKVVLASRNEEALRQVANGCPGSSECVIIPTDVTNHTACKELIDKTVQKLGRIDVLIANAGLSMRAMTHEATLEVFKRVMDVNFYGTLYCLHAALPHLLKSRGVVVGISSVSGFKGLPARAGYAASKYAINGLLEAVKIENLKTGLHVLTVCPGFATSNIRINALGANGEPQGFSPRDENKMMHPDQVARSVLNAIKRRRNFLVLTTEGKLALWLNKFFPNLVTRLVYNSLARELQSPIHSGIQENK